MNMLLAVTDHLTVLAAADPGTGSGATTGAGLADAIRNFIAPLFLLAISIAAMTFLFKRQVTEFLQFAALGIGVAVFFYVPGIVEGIARLVAAAI